MKRLTIIGPPGCGKTTSLMNRLHEELRGSLGIGDFAVLTFTRAARHEVEGRIRRNHGTSCEWVRTIHSAALRMRGRDKVKLLTDEHLQDFSQRFSYELSGLGAASDVDAEPTAPTMRTPDDGCRYILDWGRNRQLTTDESFARCPVVGVEESRFALFVRRYKEFKAEQGLVDFVDLLEHVVRDGTSLPVSVGFVDEAQDLSPLQARAAEVLLARCKRLYVAGDDDQAIYGFQGGRADWFLELARSSECDSLTHSHRVPSSVKPIADAIIEANTDRLAKSWTSSAHAGRVLHAATDRAMDAVDGACSTLVLARNRMYLRQHARALLERAVPYVIEGDGYPNPLGAPSLVRAVDAAQALRTGDFEKLGAASVADLVRLVPKTLGTAQGSTATKLSKRSGTLTRAELLDDLAPLVSALRELGVTACLEGLPVWKAEYFERLLDAHGGVPTPRVVLTSIHGAKGREADLVVVVPDMTRSTFNEYTHRREGAEGENRVFYVAVTRTKDTLVLVQPKTRRHFKYPSRVVTEVRS